MKLFAALLLMFASVPNALAAEEWKPLVNGQDLTGWQIIAGKAERWTVDTGVLICKGESPGDEWIATNEQFDDFELAFEYQLGEHGNSGVFLRAPLTGNPWVEGIEIQLLDDYSKKWKELKSDQLTGAIYAVVAPSKQATKPAGQWQSMLIRCVGRQVTVTINGQQVLAAKLDEYSAFNQKVPGLLRKSGHIGFQNHGDPISFRKIRVRHVLSDSG